MAMKPAIGVDLDDTIAYTSGTIMRIIKEDYNIDPKNVGLGHHDSRSSMSITQEQWDKIYESLWDHADEIPLTDKRIPKIIDRLRKDYLIYIVTATRGNGDEFIPWLSEHGIKYDGIIRVNHASEKIEHSHKYNIKYYIDDHIVVAQSVADGGETAILLRKSWNESFIAENKNPNIIPVRNWGQIEKIIRKSKVK